MNLTLAIPAYNDLDELIHLLTRAATLDIMTHVVVVDDGSDIPITADALLAAGRLRPDQLTLLRHATPQGPGVARNLALEHVPTDHVIFMDADDLPTRDIIHLMRDLDGQDFDFCIFQHHDTRQEREHSWGQTAHDHAFWQAAGVDVGALSPVSANAAAQLSGTANYPWNKIYRTTFLRDHAIGCSDIMVHEDIELHWRSFIKAKSILASDRIGVIHVIHESGSRLTNRTGPERLQVFGPLERIAAEIEMEIEAEIEGGGHGDIYALPFFSFALGLFNWIADNLAPAYQAEFNTLTGAFITHHIPPALLAQIAIAKPDMTARILARTGPREEGLEEQP